MCLLCVLKVNVDCVDMVRASFTPWQAKMDEKSCQFYALAGQALEKGFEVGYAAHSYGQCMAYADRSWLLPYSL